MRQGPVPLIVRQACGTRARSLDDLSRECARGMNERRTDLTGENYQMPKYLLRTDVNDRRKGDRAVRGSALMRERYSRMIFYIEIHT